ncbi:MULTISPECIES: type IV secretion system protein VirB3 [Hydrogenophaga]|uniref:type IV secretion system protein VirB3 n=1 Tax=Hydrogenophaga TaxID=47420 RepID=UPI0009A3DA4C
MNRDTVFRGCTRPAMIIGVPYLPFVVGAGTPLVLAMYISWWFLLLIPFSVLIMRLMAKRDEMIFRLIGLNLVFRFLPRNLNAAGGAWVFSPQRQSKGNRGKKMEPYA